MKNIEQITYSCKSGSVTIKKDNTRTYIGEWGNSVLSTLIKCNMININPLQFQRLFIEVFQPMTPQGFSVLSEFND